MRSKKRKKNLKKDDFKLAWSMGREETASLIQTEQSLQGGNQGLGRSCLRKEKVRWADSLWRQGSAACPWSLCPLCSSFSHSELVQSSGGVARGHSHQWGPSSHSEKGAPAAAPAVKGGRGGTSGGRGSLEAPGMSEAAKQRGTRWHSVNARTWAFFPINKGWFTSKITSQCLASSSWFNHLTNRIITHY